MSKKQLQHLSKRGHRQAGLRLTATPEWGASLRGPQRGLESAAWHDGRKVTAAPFAIAAKRKVNARLEKRTAPHLVDGRGLEPQAQQLLSDDEAQVDVGLFVPRRAQQGAGGIAGAGCQELGRDLF